MEIIGKGYADSYLGDKIMTLRSMMITFMSTARNEVAFKAEWIDVSKNFASMSVRITTKNGMLISEAILQFVFIKSRNKNLDLVNEGNTGTP